LAFGTSPFGGRIVRIESASSNYNRRLKRKRELWHRRNPEKASQQKPMEVHRMCTCRRLMRVRWARKAPFRTKEGRYLPRQRMKMRLRLNRKNTKIRLMRGITQNQLIIIVKPNETL
jgi:hypothetical protein